MKSKFLLSTALAAALWSVSALAQAPDQVPGTPVPTQIVYLPQLPTVAGLTASAAAANVTVARADQSDGKIVIVYKYPNGATTTVAYELMPAGAEPAPGPAPAYATAAAAPTTTTVYETAPAYYYPGYYPYWGWYAPVSIGIGWGWHGGWGGGGFRGGFRR